MKTGLKYLLYPLLVLMWLPVTAQKFSFRNYPVNLYKGRPAKLLIKGNPLAETFKTLIKDTYYSKQFIKKWHGETGLNFGGHYCFVYWGCGAPRPRLIPRAIRRQP